MILDIRNVSLVRDGISILKNINWFVKPGENWALIGLNGSGKTTLLKMITGYLSPSKGEMYVLGKKFGRVDLRELRKSIGWVSSSLQESLYASDTIEEIVLSGKFASIGLYEKPEKEDYKKAENLMEQFELSRMKDRMYYTLSQGEKQKTTIARALMCTPHLLILDEPCVGLDIFARENFLSFVENICNIEDAPTLLYVSHHVEEITPLFKQVLFLKDGEIHSAGKTKDLLTNDNLIKFYGKPVEIDWRNGNPWIKLKDSIKR
ncbi:MAG: ABC transporter ATP-binding protein [Ignavibacteriaceae bacterium]